MRNRGMKGYPFRRRAGSPPRPSPARREGVGGKNSTYSTPFVSECFSVLSEAPRGQIRMNSTVLNFLVPSWHWHLCRFSLSRLIPRNLRQFRVGILHSEEFLGLISIAGLGTHNGCPCPVCLGRCWWYNGDLAEGLAGSFTGPGGIMARDEEAEHGAVPTVPLQGEGEGGPFEFLQARGAGLEPGPGKDRIGLPP